MFLFLISSVLAAAFIVSVINFFIDRHNVLKVTSQFGGVTPVPLLGNLLMTKLHPVDIFNFITSFPRNCGKNSVIHLFNNTYNIAVTNLDDIERVMTNTKATKKGYSYTLLKPWLGSGLLISHGQKWFTRRKILTPSFHFNILGQYVDVFNKQSDIFVEKISKFCNGERFDIYPFVTHNALDIICETSMGVSVNAQGDGNTKYVQALKRMSTLFIQRNFSALRKYPDLYGLSPAGFEERRLIKTLHKFTNDVIVSRRSQLIDECDDNEVNNVDTNDFGIKKKMTLLDMLLRATIDGQPLSNEDIREEVDTFMFEGHDTTTSAISLLIHQLSMEPEIQQKVYEDIINVLGDRKHLTCEDFAEMKYLDCVIKESFRLYPPVPIIQRSSITDFKIDGIDIPIDTEILISIFNIHRDPDNFPNPEKFDPSRFEGDKDHKRHPYAYIPFSAGFRNCIGQKFALFETKTVVSKLLMNYKFIPAENNKLLLQGDLVLKSASGVYVKIVKR